MFSRCDVSNYNKFKVASCFSLSELVPYYSDPIFEY